ncbi:FAD-binding protein [Streptomyces sp. NPDC005648]|uniref:FAD-binding protein n=1 Tax=Streptomyces sp. NPDC005648 TaxID=3157044 RepID=UPI0033AAC2BE
MVPGVHATRSGGLGDDIEDVRTYLRGVVDDPSREALQDVYLAAGVQLIDELEQNPWFGSFVHGPVPDYYSSVPGSSPTGHTVFPLPVEVARLGDRRALMRDSLPTERFGFDEGPLLSGGRALTGRALSAYLEADHGELCVNTALENLIVEDGRVTGIEVTSEGERVRDPGRPGRAAGGRRLRARPRAAREAPGAAHRRVVQRRPG